MKNYLFPLALLAFGGAAHATSYYVSDCGSGASAQCVAGNDSSAGTSPAAPWKSCDKVTAQFPGLAVGDQVLFARGSAQNACKLSYLSNLKSTAANPIVIGAYTPTWASSTTAVPILNGTTSTYTLGLLNSGNSTHDEGYVIQDLHFVGPGVSAQMPALMMSNDVKYVTIQRVEIEQSSLGIQCNGGTNNPLSAGSNGLTEHIVIRNSNIHHNRGIGILSGCNDILIENNTLDNNGIGMLDHHIYIGGAEISGVLQTVTQVVIRSNRLTNNSPYASASAASPTPGGCGAVAIVAHGLHDGLIIEGNTVIEPTPPANASCWGISADSGGYGNKEGFTNVAIRGNTVINFGVGIGLDLCDTCVIENNYIYSEAPAPSGVIAPSKYFETPLAGDTLINKLTVRNNSVYLKNPTFGSVGIRVSRDGTGHNVASNLVYFGTGSTSATSCFYTSGLAAGAFAAFDYNLCYFAGTTGTWDTARGSLTAQRAVGFDVHSQSTNPNVTPSTAPYALTTASTSPAVKAGHPSLSSRFAIGGLQRSVTPDIGAYQFGASVVVPSAPTGVGIQ